jgi:thiamine-monophosphate kinase
MIAVSDERPLSEFELIDHYFSGRQVSGRHAAARSDVILGVGDDAALLRVPEHTELVAAVDTLVAGRHFPLDRAPHSIGHCALAVNLSDMAAMGATPAWATLSLTMPSADRNWLERFSSGLLQLASEHGVALVGGDTTSGPLTISVQILGHVEQGTALRRSGAQPGDWLAVTGTLGDAGAGLALTTAGLAAANRAAADELIARFEYPTPRVVFGRRARGIASAAMDLSDGLAGDLPKLAAASGLAARVDIERLPLSAALQAVVPQDRARQLALSAGDDYELLLAVAPGRFDELAALAHQLNLRLSVIGELCRGNSVEWRSEGAEFQGPVRGYDHFG